MAIRMYLNWIAFILVGLLLLTSCNRGASDATTRFTPPRADVRMGELLTLESVSYQVNEVYTQESLVLEDSPLGSSSMELQDKSMYFCQVEITVVNHTDQLQTIQLESIQFIGNDGQDYDPLGKLSDNSLAPKETRDFTLTFVVKRGVEVGGVVVVSDLSGEASGVIALQR
jgi:hypothetical protein